MTGRASRRLALLFGAGLVVAIGIRLLLLPSPGLPGDLDQFATWAGWLRDHPIGDAYGDLSLSFGPVMTIIWAILAAVQPAFSGALDAADPVVRATLKLPAILADLGLAAGVAWHLRERPRVAVLAGLGVALHPALIDVSAWWGQDDAVYLLPALVAFLLATQGHFSLAAAALSLALLTKPQALPIMVPFGAWFVGRLGFRGAIRPAVAGALMLVVGWLPFLPDGPFDYLQGLAAYQDGPFGVLSVRAWNPWWLVQVAGAGGEFVLDQVPIVGPLTFRLAGLVIAGLFELVVVVAVLRRPSTAALAWGVVAATLVAFTALTTMHERYAYPALIFVALCVPDRRAIALWLGLSVVVTLNLLAAAPPLPEIGALLPVDGTLSIIGSLAMTTFALISLLILTRITSTPGGDSTPPSPVAPVTPLAPATPLAPGLR